MGNPIDKMTKDLLDAAADGPEAMENWLKDLQKEVGAPDGDELPETIELEYSDGTKETLSPPPQHSMQALSRVRFYSHDNPAPQEVIDRWSGDDEDDEYFDDDGNQIKPFDHQIPIVDPDLPHDEDNE